MKNRKQLLITIEEIYQLLVNSGTQYMSYRKILNVFRKKDYDFCGYTEIAISHFISTFLTDKMSKQELEFYLDREKGTVYKVVRREQ
jgi:hypothetical protein